MNAAGHRLRLRRYNGRTDAYHVARRRRCCGSWSVIGAVVKRGAFWFWSQQLPLDVERLPQQFPTGSPESAARALEREMLRCLRVLQTKRGQRSAGAVRAGTTSRGATL